MLGFDGSCHKAFLKDTFQSKLNRFIELLFIFSPKYHLRKRTAGSKQIMVWFDVFPKVFFHFPIVGFLGIRLRPPKYIKFFEVSKTTHTDGTFRGWGAKKPKLYSLSELRV